MFSINNEILKNLCSINHFSIDEGKMIFIGLRGLLPVNEYNNEFAQEHLVQLEEIDYIQINVSMIKN